MPHLHEVRDTDTHFVIDPITRAITNPNSAKNKLMQGDHNSEIYTFEIPKEVEGHDMSLCNEIRIHYNDISADKANESKDVYIVTDMKVDETVTDTLVFSWLISDHATMYAGLLSFRIQFLCIDDDGTVTYKWHTDIFKGITISDGFDNSEAVIEEYSDALTRWMEETEAAMESEMHKALEEAKASGQFKGDPGKSAYEYAKDGGYTGTEAEFIAKLAQDIVPISGGGTGAGERKEALFNLAFLGVEPISSVADDTVANWNALGTGYAWYGSDGRLTDQPTSYALLVNLAYGSDLTQFWIAQPIGRVYKRSGSSAGWNGTWFMSYDEKNKPTPTDIGAKSIKGGTLIANGSDLDDYKTLGNYHCISDADASSLSNSPIKNAFNMVVGYPTGQNAYLYQELFNYLTGTRYYRECLASSGKWTGWVKTYDSSNKPTAADVGALPSTANYSTVGASPDGLVVNKYTVKTDTEIDNAITTVYASMADNSSRFMTMFVDSSGLGISGGGWHLVVNRTTATYGTVYGTGYGSNSMKMRFLKGGNLTAWQYVVTASDIGVGDDHINALIDAKLGVIENGTY